MGRIVEFAAPRDRLKTIVRTNTQRDGWRQHMDDLQVLIGERPTVYDVLAFQAHRFAEQARARRAQVVSSPPTPRLRVPTPAPKLRRSRSTKYVVTRTPSQSISPSSEVRVADSRSSWCRLIDLLQVIAPDRPAITAAIEQCIETIVVDEMRHRIHARLRRLPPDDVAKVEALTAQLAGEDEPTPEEGA